MNEEEVIRRKKRNFIIIGVVVVVFALTLKGIGEYKMAKIK